MKIEEESWSCAVRAGREAVVVLGGAGRARRAYIEATRGSRSVRSVEVKGMMPGCPGGCCGQLACVNGLHCYRVVLTGHAWRRLGLAWS
jgi:hypothetical protein